MVSDPYQRNNRNRGVKKTEHDLKKKRKKNNNQRSNEFSELFFI